MSESWLKSAPESTKVHSFDYGAWFRHEITRVRQAGSVGFFNVVHGELELTVFKWVGYAIFGFALYPQIFGQISLKNDAKFSFLMRDLQKVMRDF